MSGEKEQKNHRKKIKKHHISMQSFRDLYLPMIIAANGVREAQMVHILKDIFFFLSAVAVIFCLSSDVQIRAVYRPKQIYREREDW